MSASFTTRPSGSPTLRGKREGPLHKVWSIAQRIVYETRKEDAGKPMATPSYSRTPLMTDWAERYRIVRKIGAGGFADVFEAVDLKLDRDVALKVIDERRSVSSRVVREVEAAASLAHPGIVSLLDFFTDGQRSFIVWELVRGRSLAELSGDLSDGEAVAAAAQVLGALAYAHSQGVVHRDIKPHNVMVDEDGRVKVMDFGIARLMDAETLTSEGDMLGTVAYMSPEQAGGKRAGPPSDVYSTAIVLYELLTGSNPVRGSTPAETIANVIAGRMPSLADVRPDLPLELVDAVDVALLRDPMQRPSAVELEDALRAVAGRLGGRRLRPQRILRPLLARLRRWGPFAERTTGALLAGGVAAALVTRLHGYPQGWALPLALATLLVWFVLPPGGLAWLLGVLAFPVFNVSVGLGVVYLVFALVLYAASARRPLAAVYPALAVALLPYWGVFLAPAAAALLGRVRGPLIAAWAGAVTVVYLLLTGTAHSPFTGFQPRNHLAAQLDGGDPLAVGAYLIRAVVTIPGLAQAAIWCVFAVGVGALFALRRLEARLWVWSVLCAALFAAEWVLPIGVWRHRGTLDVLLPSVAVVAVALLLALLAAGEGEAET